MRLFFSNRWLSPGIRWYRKIRYRNGFGVHSPFVFGLITKVIEERNPYYCFAAIEGVRRWMLSDRGPAAETARSVSSHRQAVSWSGVVRREAVTSRQGQLLFRLVRYLKSRYILQIGSGGAVSTLYLVAGSSGIRATVVESDPVRAASAASWVEKCAAQPVKFLTGPYETVLPEAFRSLPRVDCVFFHIPQEGGNIHRALFREAVGQVHDETFFIIEGIRSDAGMKSFWKDACAHPAVSVTIDLYSFGLIFFNPKLHKRNYIVYF